MNTKMIFLRAYLLGVLALFTQTLSAQEGFKIAIDGGGDDYGQSIDIFPNGDLVVGAVTNSFGSGEGNWLISKFSSGGNLIWSKIIETNDPREEVLAIKAMSNGNICFIGNTPNASFKRSTCILLDPSGNALWSHTLSATSFVLSGIKEISNEDILITGYTNSFGEGGSDGIIIRLSNNGEIIWAKTLGTPNSETQDRFHHNIELQDGSILAVGDTQRIATNTYSPWLVKCSSTGEIIQEFIYSSSVFSVLIFNSIVQDEIGNLYIGGESADNVFNNFIIKLDSEFNVIWQRTWPNGSDPTGSGIDYRNGQGGFLFGMTDNKLSTLCRFRQNGDLLFNRINLALVAKSTTPKHAVIVDENRNVYLIGNSTSEIGSSKDIILTQVLSNENSDCIESIDLEINDITLSKSETNSVSNDVSNFNEIDLTVTDVTDQLAIDVLCGVICPLSVDINIETACVGQETDFNPIVESSSLDLTIQWDISNGETRNVPSFSTVFNESGEYSVSLLVTDNISECTAESLQTFTIQEDQLEELTDCNISTEVVGIPETFDLSGEDLGESYQGTWSIVSEGAGEIDNISSPETFVSNLGYGEYVFNWNISNMICNTSATCSHTLLIFPLEGCTLEYAINYDPEAIINDGSCEFDFTICDCDQNSHSPDVFEQLGDEIPNNDIDLNFNCVTWGYDCGDISGAPNDDPYDVCNGNFPENNGCPCLPGELDLSMGISQFINDTTEIDGQLIIDHVCLNVVNVIPTISGNCSVIDLCFAFEDGEYSCLNLPEIESEYFSGDLIEFRTTVEAQQAHFYYTTEAGTSDTYSIHIPQCGTGIQEEVENQISIYPNPASHTIYVQTHPPFSRRAKLTLANSLGKKVKTVEVNETGLTAIELEELSDGIYFLCLSVDRSTINTQKIVVQRE